jgi:hypothetical protein
MAVRSRDRFSQQAPDIGEHWLSLLAELARETR